MAAVDHETIIIERLWTLLEAHAAFTALVLPGNRIKLVGDAARVPVKMDLGSFPKVIIYIGGVSDSLFALEESYAMRAGATFNVATQPVAEDLLFGVVIEIQHGTSFATARKVVAEIMTVLRKAGPALGITAFRIQRVGPATQQNQNSFTSGPGTDDRGIAGAKPLRSTISLPVLVRTNTKDMLI